MVRKQLVADLLLRLMEENVVVIPKRGLIWRLGWGQDKPGAWAQLLDVWEECGGARVALHGIEYAGKLVLFYGRPGDKIEHVTDWAKEDEKAKAA